METVGFIGLGNMGAGMAANIQKAGYPMVIHDINEGTTKPFLESGARLASSPTEVASLADITLTSLPGPKEVEKVFIGPNGLLSGVSEGRIYVDLSTSRPTLIRELEPMFRQKGAHILDAPVSGGKSGAASGNLAVMVGGDKDVFDRIKPLLDAFGDKVFYAGGIGSGCVAKLVHNMISHGVRQAIVEGLTLGVKAGVEAEALWQCIRRGANGRMSALHEGIPRHMFTGNYQTPTFTLALARKDIGLATELGREYDVPLPVANLAEQIAIQAINRGWGEWDSSASYILQEESAGVEVRASNVDPEKSARFISTHPED